MRSILIRLLLLAGAALGLSACGIYSFSGTSIQSDVKTIKDQITKIQDDIRSINSQIAGLTSTIEEWKKRWLCPEHPGTP